jgi:Mannosyltransferase OCH1 and related enzymes
MSIPKRIHQIHLGGPPDETTVNHLRSVGYQHEGWTRVIWDELMLEQLLNVRVSALKEELGTWASVSNKLRLEILFVCGGVYLDTDIEAVDTLEALPLGDMRNFAAEQDGGRICNAVMGAAPRSNWIKWQLDHWTDYDPRDAASGVYLATAAPRDELTVIAQRMVYPWLYDTPTAERKTYPETILVHHWKGSWIQK